MSFWPPLIPLQMFRSLRGFVDSKSDHNLNSSQSMVLLLPFASNHEKKPSQNIITKYLSLLCEKMFFKATPKKKFCKSAD